MFDHLLRNLGTPEYDLCQVLGRYSQVPPNFRETLSLCERHQRRTDSRSHQSRHLSFLHQTRRSRVYHTRSRYLSCLAGEAHSAALGHLEGGVLVL